MPKQKALSGSTDHLRAIVNTTTDALIVIDQASSVISWNNAAESMFGYSANEMTGKSLHVSIPERFRQAHDDGLKRVGGGGEQQHASKRAHEALTRIVPGLIRSWVSP